MKPPNGFGKNLVSEKQLGDLLGKFKFKIVSAETQKPAKIRPALRTSRFDTLEAVSTVRNIKEGFLVECEAVNQCRLDAGVYRGPALGVWFRLTQDFASQGGHIALSTEYVANEIEQRIAFTPIEVGVGNLVCLVA